MEKRLDSSEHEADSAETKLNLMESVISKLKLGGEELYLMSKVGSTPVLSLLSDGSKQNRPVSEAPTPQHQQQPALLSPAPERPFITEANVIMYLDMIHERVLELKGDERGGP